MRTRAGIFLICTLVAATARAQSPATSVDVSGGVGYLHAFYPEDEHGALAVLASTRLRMRTLLMFEPELGYSRDVDRREFMLAQHRDAIPRTIHTQTSWNVGGNVIVAKPSGSLRPFGGGGAGIYWERSRFTTIVPQGLPNAGTFRTGNSSGPRFGAQGITGVDVALSRRVALFGAFRAEVRAVWESAVFTFSGLGGVRVVMR